MDTSLSHLEEKQSCWFHLRRARLHAKGLTRPIKFVFSHFNQISETGPGLLWTRVFGVQSLLVHCNSTKHSVRFHQNSGSVDFGVKSHQAAEEAFWRAGCWRINHSLLGLVSNDCENNFSLYHQRGKILDHCIDPAAFSHYCGIVPTHVVYMHDFNSIIYLLHSADGRVGGVGGCGGCFQFINNKLSHTEAQN